MSQNRYQEDRESLKELLQQYRNLKLGRQHRFLEEDAFLRIIDYFDEKDNVKEALEAVERAYNEDEPYDLICLDIMMPVKDGISLAKDVRLLNSKMPILFLTAKSQKDDILAGFEVGADDYITKPFHSVELRARIKAVLRRSNGQNGVSARADLLHDGKCRERQTHTGIAATYFHLCAFAPGPGKRHCVVDDTPHAIARRPDQGPQCLVP